MYIKKEPKKTLLRWPNCWLEKPIFTNCWETINKVLNAMKNRYQKINSTRLKMR